MHRLGLKRWTPFTLLLPLSACAAPAHPEIRAVIDAQVAAWNVGDIEGFMRGYWKSDDLVFTTPEDELRGWEALLERYQSRYETPEQMGRLTVDRMIVSRTGEDTADLSGSYRFDTAEGRRTGRFFMKMRRIDGEWIIVRDHTVPNP